jgi:hypothetical protein
MIFHVVKAQDAGRKWFQIVQRLFYFRPTECTANFLPAIPPLPVSVEFHRGKPTRPEIFIARFEVSKKVIARSILDRPGHLLGLEICFIV